MRSLMIVLAGAAIMGFSACESETCYTCEGYLGLENECCGDKDKCELFRKDCDANGGKMILKGDKDKKDS